MKENDIFMINVRAIEKEISDGLNILNKNYKLNQLDCGSFCSLKMQNMTYNIKQYEIVGVGNLLLMESKDSKGLQMLSFVITPYYKNLPLFSGDFLFINENRNVLLEYYDLVKEKDAQYKAYTDKLQAIKDKYSYLPDIKLKECWYDTLKTVSITKKTTVAQDNDIFSMFIENLHTFIEKEQETDILSDSDRRIKWEITKDYANKLIDIEGVSTSVFKNSIGVESTRKFFHEVFFGIERFR